MALLPCPLQSRVALRTQRRVSSRTQQGHHNEGVALLRGAHQRRSALVVLLVERRPSRDEGLRELEVPAVAGRHKRCASILLGGVDRGTAAEQRLRSVHRATLRRVYQCRRTVLWVARLNIGTRIDQRLDRLDVARLLAGCSLERV